MRGGVPGRGAVEREEGVAGLGGWGGGRGGRAGARGGGGGAAEFVDRLGVGAAPFDVEEAAHCFFVRS